MGKLIFVVSDKNLIIKNNNLKTLKHSNLLNTMSTFTVQQIEAAMNAPVEHPTGPRSSKVIASARMASPINAANAAKERKRRIASEKKDAIKKRKLDSDVKKAQKADKSHIAFKKSLKATRRQLILKWKENAKTIKAAKKAEKKAIASAKKAIASAKKAAKAIKKAAKKEAIVAKKAEKANKPPAPKKAKLTDEQKQENKAKRAYQTEMNRREKWEREFQSKFRTPGRGIYNLKAWFEREREAVVSLV